MNHGFMYPEGTLTLFVIRTKQSANTFNARMTAFMTGYFGDNGVGRVEADQFENDGFDRLEGVSMLMGEHGNYYPSSAWDYPGDTGRKSVAILFDHRPSENVITFMKERAYTFARQYNINIVGFYVTELTTTYAVGEYQYS